jgi:CheY-like chemotaxis protein
MILLDARRVPLPEAAEGVVRRWSTASVVAWTAGGASAIEASVGVPIRARVLTIDPRSGERALRVVAEAILARVLEREERRTRQFSATRPALRVLVADDDDAIRESLVELLETEGYATTAARNGAEALELLRAHAVSVVLLDLKMPEVDGYEFRARQLEDPAIADVPVIVISADHRADVARLAGAELVSKPFDVAPLLAMIRELIERRALARAAGA